MNISNCSLKDECQFVKELKNKISNMKESYETDAEAKFYDYVDKYNSKKLLTANDYVELNKNNEILMIYNQTLLKENEELKKQLEVSNELVAQGTLIEMKLRNEVNRWRKEYQDTYKDVRIEIKEYKTQQKEFIKWLENYLELLDYNNIEEQITYDTIEEISQKYKETIGVSNDY